MNNLVADMAGLRFARLRITSFAGSRRYRAFWNCLCDCGNEVTVEGKKLRQGHTQSCGCFHRERAAEAHLIHGHSRRRPSSTAKRDISREYHAWLNMKQRVLNPNSDDYNNYGERGIVICDRWKGSFENFLADMGPCPTGLELDRIEVNGNYEPSNCRWTNEIIQARNKRSFITAHGMEAIYG